MFAIFKLHINNTRLLFLFQTKILTDVKKDILIEIQNTLALFICNFKIIFGKISARSMFFVHIH